MQTYWSAFSLFEDAFVTGFLAICLTVRSLVPYPDKKGGIKK